MAFIYIKKNLLKCNVCFLNHVHKSPERLSMNRDGRTVSQGSRLCLIMSFFLFQLIDITGKDQDESMIALHDCNGDVNRAINVLLEGSPDTVSIGFV